MPRATIAGALSPTNAKKKRAKDENEAATTSADDGGDGVLVDQFVREFHAVLRQIHAAHTGGTGDVETQAETRSIAHYGVVGQRLFALVRRLVDRTAELVVDQKARLLLQYGDKLANVQEFQAADRYFYAEVVKLSIPVGDVVAQRSKDDVYVRAVFGQATCRFQCTKRADPFTRFPGTLEALLKALQLLQQGMEVAVELERASPHKHAWLLLNGSVLVYGIARPLQTLGFAREVVAYLKWCIMCLESTVMLSTAKYILWRLQLYASVCECLEQLASQRPKRSAVHLQSALACAEHAAQAVTRLRREEELDAPLPKLVLATLHQAELIAEALVGRARVTAKGETFGRKAIQSLARFQEPKDRLRLVIDELDKLAHISGSQVTAGELFDFALELTRPTIQSLLQIGGDSEGKTPLVEMVDSNLPMAFHLTLLRHAHRLQRTDNASQLVEAAKARSRSFNRDDELVLELNFWGALIDLEQPVPTDANGTPRSDGETQQQKLVAVAEAANNLVIRVKEAVPSALRDLLVAASLRLWKEGATDMLRKLDESLKAASAEPGSQLLRQTILLVEAIYTVLRAVDFDDLILLGEMCLRLCVLLNAQENRRKAIHTVRNFLIVLNTYRDELVRISNHFACTSRHAVACASFSFDMSRDSSSSDCHPGENSLPTSSRHEVGVRGTGSQLGGLVQELACIQADALKLLFQLELEEAAMIDAIERDPSSQTPTTSTGATRSSMLASTESILQKEFKKNLHARVLLNIQLLQRVGRASSRTGAFVDECFKLLSQADTQERDLIKHLADSEPHAETATPRAPRIVKRCSSSITVQVIPFEPSSAATRRRTIAYYMVFGKPSGAGTAVSLNNTDFPGTAEPLYSPDLFVTVSGLSPNTSYVFAAAAFDQEGEIIQGIGQTTKPVAALNPLPSVACYGYLSQVCYGLELLEPAQKAGMHVYDLIASKDFANRPGWASNYFYRHALKRDVIARWPFPLLDMATQSILVLCDAEDGDALRDGELMSDGLVLRGRQIKALEASRMISIGLEIASAAADYEQIRALSFKGYRILLPMLHLDDTNALTFAALSTYYQALWCIPANLWDTDTRNIAARIAFELMRIAWRHHHLTHAAYSQVLKLRTGNGTTEDSLSCTELSVLVDSIALAEGSIGRQLVDSPADARPLTAQPLSGKTGGAAPAGGAKPPTAAVSSTPQATARGADELTLPCVNEIIAQSKLNLREAFKVLEPYLKTNRDSLEVFCKLSQCALDASEEGLLEEWMPLMKVTGNIGSICKEDLKRAGLRHLLLEPVAAPIVSAPSTARSTAKTPRAQEAAAQNTSADSAVIPQPPSLSDPDNGEDDEYVYTWCGEICLIEAIIEYRKLVRHQNDHHKADCMCGPRYDYAFSILNDAAATGQDTAIVPSENIPADDNMETTPRDSEEQSPSLNLFTRLLARTAASCRLFSRVQAWQALQTAAQYASNSIWLAWMSPEAIGLSRHSCTLDDLTVCVNSLLNMIEVIAATLKEEQAGKTQTTLPAQNDASKSSTTPQNRTLSAASTTVVVSVMSSLNVDQTWIANLLEFTLQALLAAKRWDQVVQIGKKYHLLSGGGTRFSEKMLPLVVYAQQQYLAEQVAHCESAQAELVAFVKAFNDAEAKKKKKKSRLVVEEILTPEEVEFRSKKEGMDSQIQELEQEKNVRQRELDELKQTQDTVSRTTNKCTQALDGCHKLVEAHRRFGEAVVKPPQITSAFSHCVALCRQKRQRRLAGKALQELGDYLWDRGDAKAAVKAWNEAIDNAFNALRATTCWRGIIGVDIEELPSTPDPLIGGEGLWTCLEACIAIAKLILSNPTSGTSSLELGRMAAATFTRIITKSSLPHPSKSFLYGFHQILSPIWPGRELLTDVERLDAPRLALMFTVTIETLLLYEHPVDAMPLIAGYEYLAAQCFDNVDHTANARRLRLDALVQCGRFHEAFQVLASLLAGTTIDQDENATIPNALALKLQFRDDKAVKDPSNTEVLAWLASVDMLKVHEDFLAMNYKPATARLSCLSVVKLVVRLAQREPIEEESTSTLRQTASLMAVSLADVLKTALQAQTERQSEETAGKQESASGAHASWELLTLHHAHAEVLLQQAINAASGGQWAATQDLCMESIHAVRRTQNAVESASSPRKAFVLSLDQTMPPAFQYRPSSLVVRARLLSSKVDLARGSLQRVVTQTQVAIEEAQSQGEQVHFVQQLELLRAEARVLLGAGATAVRELTALRDAFGSSHSCESLPYVELVRVLAFVLRTHAMESHDADCKLQQVLTLLEEAETTLDRVLRCDGWIGAGVDVVSDKRMSIFNPYIGVFVQLKAEIAQGLMETPPKNPDGSLSRMQRALQIIDLALNAANHSSQSLAPTKAKLLFQRGAILKKILLNDASRHDELFHQCAASLVASVEEAIRVEVGGHDRELIRLALMELVDLYGAKLVSGKEAEHLQAAFHYLNLALAIRSQQMTLSDSLELQTGTLANTDKLPVFLVQEIAQSAGGASSVVAEPARSTAPPTKGATSQGMSDASKRPYVDAARVVNFFRNVLRTKTLLPPCTDFQENVAVLLHAFLVQNHSTYGKICCVQSVPAIPNDDPAIKGGVICTQWMRDLCPAFSSAVNGSSERKTVSLYVTLGTVRIDGYSILSENDDVIRARLERFSTSPLLTKRSGIVETDIRKIGEHLSRLRVDMEDESSLVIDRSALEQRFRTIILQIQRLFKQSSVSRPCVDEAQEHTTSDAVDLDAGVPTDYRVLDCFNVEIPITCSLDSVTILEAMFHVVEGVNNAVDNEVCYLLRDLLDN